MAKIAYTNKVEGATGETGKYTAANANEVKTSVNALYDAALPRTGTAVNLLTGIELDRVAGTWYTTLAQSGAEEIIIATSSAVIGGVAILPITLDGAAITVTGATKHPKSDDAQTTAAAVDEYTFWRDANGYNYSITNK